MNNLCKFFAEALGSRAAATSPCQVTRLMFRALWFAAALILGWLSLLDRIPQPAVQALLLFLTAILLLNYFLTAGRQGWARHVDLRWWVALHGARIAGACLLWFHAGGELPSVFAAPAGASGVAIAIGALILCRLPTDAPRTRTALLLWNAVGLADVLWFLGTTGWLACLHPDELRAFLHLPLSLVPTVFIPLILASHILIFHRLLGQPIIRMGLPGLRTEGSRPLNEP
jgi:hypothetical protein